MFGKVAEYRGGYDAESLCPKCGCDEVESNFSEAAPMGLRFFFWPIRIRTRADVMQGWPASEHMRRICERCGYYWYEDPLTAARPKMAPVRNRRTDVVELPGREMAS